MSEWRDKPWYPGRPIAVVLYRGDNGWSFALTTDRPAIVDGRLGQPDLEPDGAKDAILRQLLDNEQVVIDGEWKSERPNFWSADLKPSE
jgi:hypothetical protein